MTGMSLGERGGEGCHLLPHDKRWVVQECRSLGSFGSDQNRRTRRVGVIKHSYQTMNRLVLSFRFLQALIAGESLNQTHHLYAVIRISKRIEISTTDTLPEKVGIYSTCTVVA